MIRVNTKSKRQKRCLLQATASVSTEDGIDILDKSIDADWLGQKHQLTQIQCRAESIVKCN